ncbi:hypothetical protein Tco_0792029 [Tanacetum coccineum]
MSSRMLSILNRSSTQTTKLLTQEDQICGYRAMTRGRYQADRATRRVFGRNNYNITLESTVDLERQLELSRERRVNLVPAEVLYSNHRSLQHIYLGIFMIRLHALHRRSAGTNALVVLKDTRWEVSLQIIITMEVDLSVGTQLVYKFPDMVLTIDDFHNHVEVAIQTHVYDTWSLEKWSTLGEPSGKWDYYVRYDAPTNTTLIEKIVATGWGDEFLREEATTRKVTILNESEEQSDWDNDERSGGEILDDKLAIKKQESELELENPFAAKRGENHTILYISKEENDDDLPYPKFQKFKQVGAQIICKHEEQAFPSTSEVESTQSYQPPHDSIMGPSWTLPLTWTESGVMLVLPADPGLWSEVISRWESITINRLNNQTWSNNKAKLAFVENLLRESEKLMWQQWQTLQLVIKSGRLYFPSTTEKHFAKLPPSLSKKIEESFKAKYPGLNSGVLPAIKFTHTFVLEMCKDVALAKELRDLSLCSAILILGYYKSNRKKYRIRKSRTYKGKPHNTHVKPFKRNYKDDKGRVKKCKCFIYGKERHFAKDYRSKQGNIARSAVYQELDLDEKWDIVSAEFDDSNVYSISEGEGNNHQSISVMVQDTPIEEATFMTRKESDESDSEQEKEEDDKFSPHAFMFHPGPPTKIAEMKENTVTNYTICYYYRILTTDMLRLDCPKCQLTTCALCAKNYLGKTVNVKGKQHQKLEEEKDFSSNKVKLLKELLKEKTEQVQQMIRDQAKEYHENKSIMQKKEELWQSKERLLIKDLTDALKIIKQLKTEQIRLEEHKDEEIRELKSQMQKEKEKQTQDQEEFSPLKIT